MIKIKKTPFHDRVVVVVVVVTHLFESSISIVIMMKAKLYRLKLNCQQQRNILASNML